ncbi:Mitochondrial fission protein [Coemansia sp. Benny D160-2]|nr:Mitochondrial fission protein [Coemansia sp. Benny D160-2]
MSIQRGRGVGGRGGKGNTDAEGSGTRSLYDYQQQAADIGTSSQNLVTRLINKILFRPGSHSLVGRLMRGSRGLDARTSSARLLAGTARSGSAKRASTGVFSTDALLADAPAPPAGSVPLIAGFRSAIEKEHRRAATEAAAAAGCGSSADGSASASEYSPETQRRQRLPPDAWDVTPMLLSSEKFDALVDDTPRELRTQVLGERAAEYGEYLRRLELARNALAQRLDEMDLRIARAGEERRAVEERLETAELIDRRRRRSRTRSAGAGSRSQSRDPVSGDRVLLPRTTVEDVSDTDELAAADDGAYYAQTDIPRLRKLLNVFRGHYAGITALACDPATDTLASGSLDTQVRVWDTESGECKHVISGHNDVIRGVQFYERFLLTASNDSRIRMWDLAMLESVRPRGAAKEAKAAEYEPAAHPPGTDPDDAGAWLQSTTPPMTPTICRHVSPVELCCEITFVGHTDAVTCFQAAPDGTMISGSADKTVREWDLATGAMRQTIDITWAINDAQTLRASQRGAPRGAAAGAATKAARPPLPLDAAGPPPSLRLLQPWESGDAGSQRRGTELADGGFIGALQFYEFALATGTADGFLRLWDLRTAQAHRQMHGHSQPITSLHFDDRSVVTASLDGSALIWDLRTGRVLQSLAFDSGIVADVRLAPSRTSGARSSSVEVWAAARDALLHRYAAGSMQRVSYAADRGYMNTGRGGGSLDDVCDGAAGFSGISRIDLPDHETLISGDDAGTIKLWSI